MIMVEEKYVFVIPCSGIGKPVGTVGRKAAYKVVEKLRPENTRITCLALLTVADEETLKEIREHPCITIDGCPAKCAQKNVESAHGTLLKSLMVTDMLKNHRDLKPEGVRELNPEGCELADLLAEETAKAVDEIMGGES